MKRLSATLLALGLAAAVGTASAQTYGGYSQRQLRERQPARPCPTVTATATSAIYDYARVVRVDPVIDSRYGNTATQQRLRATTATRQRRSNGQRCYEPSAAIDNGGYASTTARYRTNDPYYPQQGRLRHQHAAARSRP